MSWNPLDQYKFLADLDRYYNLLKQWGAEPGIGWGNGASVNLPRVFFVDSGNGASTNNGLTPANALSTIDAAVGFCSANRGDIIVALPGHTETVAAAAGLVLDIAGITLVGVGTGSNRPTVNFITAVGADMDITAANVTIINFLFTGGVDALTNPIHIAAADCSLIDCETKDVTGQATDFIVTTAAADRLKLIRWVHRGATAAGAATAISIVGGDGIVIEEPWIDGNFSTAAIENVTTAATNLSIYGGAKPAYIRTRNAADVGITLVATTTANVGPNIYIRVQDDAANITEAVVGAAAQFFDPIYVANGDNERGLQWNGAQSADL